MMVTDYIQQQFNNRSITFSIEVEEGEIPEIPQYLALNSRQRFERIAEQYPLLRDLKDKLKLELDY
jgi:DNA polymerase-3 subunit gamma/tau